jgi:hypothetical protein
MPRGNSATVGSTRVAPNGYHYVKTEDGWRLKHHVVMEEHLGRKLEEGERVHFKSGSNKANFTAEDLVLVQQGTASVRRKVSQLRSRITELQTELQYWENQLPPSERS